MTAKLRIVLAAISFIHVAMPVSAQDRAYFRMGAMTPATEAVVVPPMTGPPAGENPVTPPPMTGEPPTVPVNDGAAFDQNAYLGKRSVAFATGIPSSTLPAPVTWTLAPGSGTLPPGLGVDEQTGIILGRPSQTGTYPNVMLRAANGARSATTAPVSFSVVASTLAYRFAGLAEGRSTAIEPDASNIVPPAIFEVDPAGSQLPSGLALDRTTGRITGSPATATTVSGLRLRATGADGATAEAGPYTVSVAAAVVGDAATTLPDAVTFASGPLAGTSRRNVTYLLGQYVPDAKPTLAPGQAVEIAYPSLVRVDGVHMFATPNAASFRVDAEVAGEWQTVRSGMAQIGGNAAPISLGRTVTTTRIRIVNTGSQTLSNVTAGPAFGGRWAQLPVVTPASRSVRLTVGQSFSAGIEVYTGAMGYGSIAFRAPYAFSIVNPGTIPYYPDAAFQLPAGLSLDAATGIVSGTATAKTLFEGKAPNGVPFSTKAATHYIVVTDADGYSAYAAARSITVE